jgi:uncharacterized protein (DUF1501 family)
MPLQSQTSAGGWNPHINHADARGNLADRLSELGWALAKFAEEIGTRAWRNAVLVVVSELVGRCSRTETAGLILATAAIISPWVAASKVVEFWANR